MALPRIEVVAFTPEDVLAAAKGGAHRVEFCSHLASGGLTPGRELAMLAFEQARSAGLGFRILVRPREGNFVYSALEKKAMLREAEGFLALGVDRVVTGSLTPNGEIDVTFLKALGDSVGMDRVVFHRAIDEAGASPSCIQQLSDAGVQGVLSSGGMPKAVEGVKTIQKMCASGLSVVAGAGVLPEHVPGLVEAGVEGIHASCRKLAVGSPGRLFDATRSTVSVEAVQALVNAVRRVDRP